MAKTEDEIIRTAMRSWRDRDKTNEFWFKNLIEGAWRSGYTNAYQRGLEDAWVAAKRVFAEMDYDECIECFGKEFSEDNLTMFDRFSATDVIQMLKKYDDKKAKGKIIRFGDEVEAWDTNSWVQFIAIGDEGDGWMVGFDRGGGSYRYPVESCRKTGKRWKVTEDGE